MVVAAAWGTELLPCRANYFAPGRFEEYCANQPFFFNSSWCKIASVGLRGNELKKFHPPRSRDDFCLLFCINPSSMIGMDCVRRFGSIELRDKQNRGKKIICFTPKELKILSVDSRAGFYYSISTVSDFPESQSPRRIIYFE